MAVALVFPGQGSQVVGMGAAVFARSEVARRTLEEADDALGSRLSAVIATGPEELLTLTENTQPAILTVSVAMLRALREQVPSLEPAMAAGHSLGEYAALVAAGSLDFADAVRLVRLRGRAMQEAVPAGVGTMAAIVGLEASVVESLCAEVVAGLVVGGVPAVVEPAGLNSPGQVVVAGHVAAVDAVVALATQAGARQAVTLKVSAPFHCALLAPAGEVLREALAGVALRPPAFPVFPNVDAVPVSEPDAIRANLVRQVCMAVRWEDDVRAMVAAGAAQFLEVGPGRTLAGLIKKVDRRLDVRSLDGLEG